MEKLKKGFSILLVLCMVFNYLPFAEFVSYAADPIIIDEIFVGKTYDKDLNRKLTYIEIRGSGLEKQTVTMFSPTTGSVDLNQLMTRTIDSNNLIKFTFNKPQNIVIDSISIGGSKSFILGEGTTMPNLTSSDRIVTVNGNLTISGSNLDKLKTGSEYSLMIDGNTYPASKIAIVPNTDNEKAIVSGITGQPGKKDIVLSRVMPKVVNSNPALYEPKKTILYSYEEQFNLTQEIDTGGFLQMIPLSGKKGDNVYFKAVSLEAYDIFFLKEQSDLFQQSNKATNIQFRANTDGNIDILQGQVPNILPGEYYVYITNKTYTINPTDEISRLKLLVKEDGTPQRFKVVEGKKELLISYIDPNKGSTVGEDAKIVGQAMGSLNIDDLIITNTTPTSVVTGTRELKVNYGAGTYQGKPITRVEKNVKIFVGGAVTFKDEYSFNILRDELNVRIPSISEDDPQLVKDVVVETETIIYDGTKEVARFPEYAVLEKGYTFIPSMVRPSQIKSIAPEFFQVSGIPGDYKTTKNLLVGVHGKDFMINSYKKDGVNITHYPIVQIGPITIDKNKNEITSGTQRIDITGLTFLVLNDKNQILDGTTGNEIGTKILFEMPEGIKVSNAVKADVTVINPIRNAEGNGHSLTETNLTEFVVVDKGAPKILKVDPYSVIVEGGDKVSVTGMEFQPGAKVYIDGSEVTGIKREDENLITFNAPPGRQGVTQLQVMNPNGGIDVYSFIYVQTYTDPKVTSLTPNWGMLNTLVKLSGENFIKPNPNGTDESVMEMYKLLGTRILIDNKDYNNYNLNPVTGRILLQDLKTKADDLILRLENGKLKVADYNHSIILKDEATKNFYAINEKLNGTIELYDGATTVYTLKAVGTTIVAVDDRNITHDLSITQDGIVVDPTSTTKTTLKLKTPYHISGNNANGYTIDGNIITKIEKDHIYFKVPALPVKGTYYVKVVNPDTKTAPSGTGLPFEYKQPTSKPELANISPNRGSMIGGYYVTLTGTGFEDDGADKTNVYFGGIKVAPADITISPDGTVIKAKVPKYIGEIVYERTVPVIVINNNGGSASIENGFTYVKPGSEPKITELRDPSGNTVGGEEVVILGKNFTFWEPFKDVDGGLKYDAGETFIDANNNNRWDSEEPYTDTNKNGRYDNGEPYTDLNGNNKWDPEELYTDANGNNKYDAPEEYTDLNGNGKYDDYRTLGTMNGIEEGSATETAIKAVLPKIFFGENEAKVTEWSEGRITIITPPHAKGPVDVYIINNDFGTSNSLKYTYASVSPKVTTIVPAKGPKKGNALAIIEGENFKPSEIKMLTATSPVSIMLVRFGDEAITTNLKDLKSGRIVNALASVELSATGMTIAYDAKDKDNHKLTVNLKQTIDGIDREFTKTYENYQDDTRYFNVNELLDIKDNTKAYPYSELVKLTVDQKEKRLVVERGYAPESVIESRGIRLKTPQYHSVGLVDVVVTNPDGEQGKSPVKYKYTNPLMDMSMIDITDESPEKIAVTPAGIEAPYFLIEATTQVELKFSIIGEGFTQDSIVKIGGVEVKVPKEAITAKRIDVVVEPQGKGFKLNTNLVITVENEDNIVASWDETMKGGMAVYIKFIETNEPQPKIDEIFVTKEYPNSGSLVGGYHMKIIGTNFAVKDDLTNTLVKIGGKETAVLAYEILADGRMQLTVLVPEGDAPGKVDVYVRNRIPLGEDTLKEGFTYLSSPRIKSIYPEEVYTTGGQTVTISGLGFMEGVKVYIGGVAVPKVTYIDSKTITFETPKREIGPVEVMVENPDKGQVKTTITYIIPLPETPVKFMAVPGNERSVNLEWSKTNLAVKYKIFAKEGEYSAKIEDYQFLAETAELSYIVSDLKPSTQYTFILWGVNSDGDSRTSAYATTTTLSTSDDKNNIKYTDDSIKYITQIKAGEKKATVNLPQTYYPIRYDIDFTKPEYGQIEHIELNIPLAAFDYDYGKLYIKNKDVQAVFTLSNIKSALSSIDTNKRSSDANVKITIDKLDSKESYLITKKLAKTEKAITPAYEINFEYQEGRSIQNLKLVQTIDFGYNIASKNRDYKKIYLRAFDEASNQAIKLKTIIETGKINDYIYGNIIEGGVYIVTEPKTTN